MITEIVSDSELRKTMPYTLGSPDTRHIKPLDLVTGLIVESPFRQLEFTYPSFEERVLKIRPNNAIIREAGIGDGGIHEHSSRLGHAVDECHLLFGYLTLWGPHTNEYEINDKIDAAWKRRKEKLSEFQTRAVKLAADDIRKLC